MALKSVKMKIFKKVFFCPFYAILSLHVKNQSCRSNEVACGQYKNKEGEKMKNGPKNVNFQNFDRCCGIVFHFVLRTYHTKKYDSTTKNVVRVLWPTSAYTKEIRIWPLAVLKQRCPWLDDIKQLSRWGSLMYFLNLKETLE